MKEVLASLAALVRRLLIGTNDTIADSALGLAFHRAYDVTTEGCETVDDAPALEHRC